MGDTPAKVKKIYNDMILSKSPLERLRMASRMFDSAKKLAMAGILKERPNLDQSRLRGELFMRIYGNDFSSAEIKRIMKEIPNMETEGKDL